MRYQDWPERLNQIIIDSRDKSFMWGSHDCCLFAANVILELIGKDFANDLRSTYSTVLEAARILKERNGVRGIATSALGNEISPSLAQRGDIVLIHTEEHGDTLTVCIGEYCIAPGADKLQYIPMNDAITAWRVC